MIPYTLLFFTLLSLFLIPGPTNVILAHTAYKKGIFAVIKSLPAEYLGYVYAIALWGLIIQITAPYWTAFYEILHFISILYIFWLAFRLWKSTDLTRHLNFNKRLSYGAMFHATLKNPKALLFAVGIFPPDVWHDWEHYKGTMLVLGVAMIPSALFWGLFGRSLLSNHRTQRRAEYIYKFFALLLIICTLPVMIRFFHHF